MTSEKQFGTNQRVGKGFGGKIAPFDNEPIKPGYQSNEAKF